MALNKVVANADEACRGIESGMTLMLGGFGLCGIPENSIAQLVKMGVRAEQQALAKHGLNYVIDTYLPEKLRNRSQFLP